MRSVTTRITDFKMRNKSGQIMCYKTGQFYLLTTGQAETISNMR